MKANLNWILIWMLAMATPDQSYSQSVHLPFKLAVAQMRVVGGALDGNLNYAAQNGAQLVLLPEAIDLGWTDPSALNMAEAVPGGKTATMLSQMAKQHQIYVCSGLTEKDGDMVYNTAVLIDPSGEVVLLHPKINELDIGHPYYALGRSLQVVQTDLGAIGLLICADARTGNHLARVLEETLNGRKFPGSPVSRR
jgi:predicted amidohydrolase